MPATTNQESVNVTRVPGRRPKPTADFLRRCFAKPVEYFSRSIAAGHEPAATERTLAAHQHDRKTYHFARLRFEPKPFHRFTEPNAFQFRPTHVTARPD